MNVNGVVPVLPSGVLTLLIDRVGAVSSLLIVPRPLPSLIVALVGPDRSTVKVSFASNTASLQTVTVIVVVVEPAAMVAVPDLVS